MTQWLLGADAVFSLIQSQKEIDMQPVRQESAGITTTFP